MSGEVHFPCLSGKILDNFVESAKAAEGLTSYLCDLSGPFPVGEKYN